MKHFLLALCAICPLFAHADIIATFSNGNIEDVTVVSIGAEEVVYNEGGTQKSIVSSQVEGILYDDGRFVTPPKKVTVADSFESIPDDSWAVDDASSDNSQAASSNNHKKREKKERKISNSDSKQKFMDVVYGIYDAFTIKKKDKSSSESTTNTNSDTESNQSSPASEDGW